MNDIGALRKWILEAWAKMWHFLKKGLAEAKSKRSLRDSSFLPFV